MFWEREREREWTPAESVKCISECEIEWLFNHESMLDDEKKKEDKS